LQHKAHSNGRIYNSGLSPKNYITYDNEDYVMKLFLALLAGLILCLNHIPVQAQPVIATIIPDICAPGMNVYVEIMAPASAKNSFGPDGFSLNNPGSSVIVRALRDSDTSKLLFGPCVISWDGRLISTQVFVPPVEIGGPNPNTDLWDRTNQEFHIPVQVIINGVPSATIDTIYIVQPFAFNDRGGDNTNRILGAGGWGKRSRRGAMIVSEMGLPANSIISIDTNDCDPYTPGNQGYLPFTLISQGRIQGRNATILANAQLHNGGPGGGGGAGKFCDVVSTAEIGGNGFSGGAPGGRNGSSIPFVNNFYTSPGTGTGSPVNSQTGGRTITGISGGETRAYEGGGGGTGHPFGLSGSGSLGNSGQIDGGYGGGSAPQDRQFGGGGAYRTAGASSNGINGGKPVGNACVVPIAGGSGGATGNPQLGFGTITCSGRGGGGGGAIRIYASEITNLSVQARGADGEANNPNGGSGSGGHIGIGAKNRLSNISADLRGGQTAPAGGDGRFRFDAGTYPSAPLFTPQNSLSNTGFRGPSTGQKFFVIRQGITNLPYSGSGKLEFYIKPDNGPWKLLDFSKLPYGDNGDSLQIAFDNLSLFPEKVYYLVAVQDHRYLYSSAGEFQNEPEKVMSQAAANILVVSEQPVLNCDTLVDIIPALVCPTDQRLDTLVIRNFGGADLRLDSIVQVYNNQGFTILNKPAPGTLIAPRDSIRIIIQFDNPPRSGTLIDTLIIYSNDPSPRKSPWFVTITGNKDEIALAYLDANRNNIIRELRVGGTCIGKTVLNEAVILNRSSFPLPTTDLILSKNPNNVFAFRALTSGDIPPASSVRIEFTYTPQQRGADTAYFIASVGKCNYADTLLIIGNGQESRLEFRPAEYTFLSVPVGRRDTGIVYLVNNGDTPAWIPVFPPPPLPFAIIETRPALPALLPIGDSIALLVEFMPSRKGADSTVLLADTKDTLQSCQSAQPFTALLRGISSASLMIVSLPIDTIINPRNDSYTIPVKYHFTPVDTLNRASFSIAFQTDSRLFYPKSASRGRLTSSILPGNRRQIQVQFDTISLLPQDSILTSINGLLQLDQVEIDTINWQGLIWNGPVLASDSLLPGLLDLSLCEAGGKRLIKEINTLIQLKAISGTAGDKSTIYIPVKELGPYQLLISDVSGHIISQYSWKEDHVQDLGTQRIYQIDNGLSAGVYFIQLRTSSGIESARLIILP
jgi:hypothetical protein